jgi:signal transduction histidine kinase
LEVKISLSFVNFNLELVIEDNGKGILDLGGSRIGSGQGLLLHSTMMAVIGGALIKETSPEEFTRVRLVLKKSFL